MELKYGCNPNQKPSRVYMEDGSDLPELFLQIKSRTFVALKYKSNI